jgi:HAD superfamily hydrolase (TIGR01509 family)
MPFTDIKHVAFDYDGVLVDSEPLYLATWTELLTTPGAQICAKFHRGRHESEVFEHVRDYLLTPAQSLSEVSAHRARRYAELVEAGRLRLIPNMQRVIAQLARDCTLSVVSNSTRAEVDSQLVRFGLRDYFMHLSCWEQGIPRKPDPALYLALLEQANLDGAGVVAIEDSQSGFEASLHAGLRTIVLTSDAAVRATAEGLGATVCESGVSLEQWFAGAWRERI